MGHLVYFLILAIVSITGKVAASSHNTRRRRLGLDVQQVEAEKIELKDLDEKRILYEGFNIARAASPGLPVFRVRRTLLGTATDGVGVLDEKSAEKATQEDLIVQRRRLKETLRIVIPNNEIPTRDSSCSDVPPTFNLYAERYEAGQCATSHLPFATRKAPRVRFSHVEKGKRWHRNSIANKSTPTHGTNISGGPTSPAFGSAGSTHTDCYRATPRLQSINRVGMLKLVEKARDLAPVPDRAAVAG